MPPFVRMLALAAVLSSNAAELPPRPDASPSGSTGFLPAAGDARPPSLPALPTGCPEFQVAWPEPQSSVIVSAADFGADTASPDNTKAFQEAIAHCKTVGASKLVVPRGTYRFTGSVPISMAFDGLSDFEFDGNESLFVFLKATGGNLVSIKNCTRSVFKNFSIDWDWDQDPLASVVEVRSVGPSGGFMDILFRDYQQFPVSSPKLGVLQQLDPDTMSPGCEGAKGWRGEDSTKYEWLSGNLLRIHAGSPADRNVFASLQPGTLFRLSHYTWFATGIDMAGNAHLTLSGINIYSCPGAGLFVVGDQHHWQLLDVNIVPPPGSRRPITSTMDHFHIRQSLGYLRMENCEFSFGGDDGLNVHDCSGFAVRSGPASLTTRNVRDIAFYHVGDPLELRYDDLSPTGFTSKITAINPVDPAAGIHEITMEKEIPDQRGGGFILFNRRYDSSRVLIRNCKFHNNQTRGLLLLASDITVEGCQFFHNQMSAIKIESGYTLESWCEGFGASNIVIRNNTFDRVNAKGSLKDEHEPAIYIGSYLKTDPSREKTAYPILHDILIENNRFVNCPGVIAFICSASRVILRNNTIVNDIPRLAPSLFRGAVGTSFSSEIFVTGNNWIPSPLTPRPGIFFDRATSDKIYCWDNSGD